MELLHTRFFRPYFEGCRALVRALLDQAEALGWGK
jgi:hypothetical protein